jgi:hypothetical protein
MKVLALHKNYSDAPKHIAKLGGTGTCADVEVGKSYLVLAISIFDGVPFLCHEGESGFLSWTPSWFFQVADGKVGKNWICNFFESSEGILTVFGPGFVAESLSKYEAVVNLEPEAVDLVRDYLASLRLSGDL